MPASIWWHKAFLISSHKDKKQAPDHIDNKQPHRFALLRYMYSSVWTERLHLSTKNNTSAARLKPVRNPSDEGSISLSVPFCLETWKVFIHFSP